MGDVIVIELVSVDGVMQDPDGAEGTERGGWAFRHGPGPVAGDKFRLGGLMETGALLLGAGRGSTSRGSGLPGPTSSPPG